MTKRPLLRGTRIWKDPETGKEYQAPCALRWAEVDFMQRDEDSGLDKWEHKGPITYVMAGDLTLHLLGKVEKWLLRWEAYENSLPPYLISAN